MPLTADLTSLQGAGIVSGFATPTIPPGTTNTFTVAGCSTYSPQSGAQLSLAMNYIKNKGWVEKSGTFAVYLYALD